MEKQVIISVGREFGSGGHEIAEKIANDLNLSLYDRKLLDDLAVQHGMDPKLLEKYDEKPRNFLLSRRVNGYSNSIAEAVAEMQAKYIKDKADSGESFVVVGRCSDVVLAGYDALFTVFICGEPEEKIERVMKKYSLSREEAITKMARHDKKRKTYHNSYSKYAWGDSRGYDVCINSKMLGIDGTAKAIENLAQLKTQ